MEGFKHLHLRIHLHLHLHLLLHLHLHLHRYMCVCVSFSLSLRAVAVVSLRIAEIDQLYQAQRMFGGIGIVLLSTFSQTENGEDPLVSLVNQVIAIRGHILVSRTHDDPCIPVCMYKKIPPCVDSKRPRVYRHHAHMLKHMCVWCGHTRRRFECTPGGVFF